MNPKDLDRFWRGVHLPFDATNNECWVWIKATDRDGYGQMQFRNKLKKAHRISFEHYKGRCDDLQVCHSCDNPSCVNPNHLFIGTALDNYNDCVDKKRRTQVFGSHLSNDDVLRIKELCKTKTQLSVARIFGISQAHVSKIVLNKCKTLC